MSPQQVAEEVRRKNWAILDTRGVIGPDSVAALIPLLQDHDQEVRELAVQCLHQAGGPEAKKGLFKAMHDPSEMIRAAASRFLNDSADSSDVAIVEREVAHNSDEYVREQMALLLGKIGGAGDIRLLATQKLTEKDEHARHAILLASARLRDPEAQQEFLRELFVDDPYLRAQRVEDLPYINDPSLVPRVAPLLDDIRLGKNVGPSHGPYFIRVCDVTVDALDKMLGHPFPFVGVAGRRYEANEIYQVKAAIASLRP